MGKAFDTFFHKVPGGPRKLIFDEIDYDIEQIDIEQINSDAFKITVRIADRLLDQMDPDIKKVLSKIIVEKTVPIPFPYTFDNCPQLSDKIDTLIKGEMLSDLNRWIALRIDKPFDNHIDPKLFEI